MATIALLALTGAAGCAPGRSGNDGGEVAPEVKFEGLRFEVYRAETLEASGTAASARMRRDTSALAAEQIAVNFPAGQGREAARLTAARGQGNVSDRWFELEGGLRLEEAEDAAVTERARYDGADGLLRGDAPVTVSGPGYVLQGPGFTLDPDRRTVQVAGGATLRTGSDGR